MKFEISSQQERLLENFEPKYDKTENPQKE
jgi:hypothetical protein